MAQIEKYSFGNTQSEHYFSLIDNKNSWACDACLNEEQATASNPQKQYCSPLEWPHLAYYDTNKACARCGDEFTFSKEEKQYWFEELQFYVDSDAKHCIPCRKTLRAEKKKQKLLSTLLSKGIDNLTEQELSQVITNYELWVKPDKVAYYKSIQRKLALKQARLAHKD